jgi:thiamine-phosphate pyrophosphorylase
VLLYYITDRRGFTGNESERRVALLRCIADAASAGVDYVQLREKDLDLADLELLAREALHVIRDRSAATKLLINTHTDIALAVGADGVHLPAGSPPASEVRAAWLRQDGNDPVIGVSTHSVVDVYEAEVRGANFAVIAPIFKKVVTGANGIGLDILREACVAADIPVLALGGVSLSNASACVEAKAAGIAGIRLFQQDDVAETVRQLRVLS